MQTQCLGQKMPEIFKTVFAVIYKTSKFWKTDYSAIYTQALAFGNILFCGLFLAKKKRKLILHTCENAHRRYVSALQWSGCNLATI